MAPTPRVTITKRERVKGSDGSAYYRYHGALNGEAIRDSINIPVATIETMSAGDADALVKRQLAGLARYMEEAHARG